MMARHRNPADRAMTQQWARELMALPNFYVLDTETTGVGKKDQIVQIGIVDKHGSFYFVNGIGNLQVEQGCKIYGQEDAKYQEAIPVQLLGQPMDGEAVIFLYHSSSCSLAKRRKIDGNKLLLPVKLS